MMWKDKYKIGIDHIDEQHRELFRRVSEFLNTLQNNQEWNDKLNKIIETISFMKEYVIYHFDEEEEFQKEIGFPGYEMHKKIHEDFKSGVNEYARYFAEHGFEKEKVQEFGGKLLAWLINHVAGQDQKIGEYLENKGGQF